MTTITAKVIADSVSEDNIRITTMELVYPRVIHSEFMTHRVFSRNASSSRAIPVERSIKAVEDDPYYPLVWTSNKPGMQGGPVLEGNELESAKNYYRGALCDAIQSARLLAATGASKQIINRILEPYSHIKVVVTSTKWANFFTLRDHPAAEPHIGFLAKAMTKAFDESVPSELEHGGWHLPYVDSRSDELEHAAIHCLEENPRLGDNEEALMDEVLRVLRKVSVARCARVSYDNHDGTKPKLLKDLQLFSDLMEKAPLHASPAEHQATPDRLIGPTWENPYLWGNFYGWKQYRKFFSTEAISDKPYVKR